MWCLDTHGWLAVMHGRKTEVNRWRNAKPMKQGVENERRDKYGFVRWRRCVVRYEEGIIIYEERGTKRTILMCVRYMTRVVDSVK